MTALIKYSVGGIMMVVLLGCQPTAAPTASVPSVSPEQFETPTPTPIPTDAQMLRTPQPSVSAQVVVQADNGEVSIASPPAGTYVCLALNGMQAGILTLSTDGLYTMGIPATAKTPTREETGGYRLDGDTKIVWRTGAFVKRYGGVSTLVFDTDFSTIDLADLGDTRNHRQDLTCNRQP